MMIKRVITAYMDSACGYHVDLNDGNGYRLYFGTVDHLRVFCAENNYRYEMA